MVLDVGFLMIVMRERWFQRSIFGMRLGIVIANTFFTAQNGVTIVNDARNPKVNKFSDA